MRSVLIIPLGELMNFIKKTTKSKYELYFSSVINPLTSFAFVQRRINAASDSPRARIIPHKA